MLIRIASLAGMLVLLMPAGWASADEPKVAKATTLEDDLKKLEGKWSSADKQPPQWTVTIQLARRDDKLRVDHSLWVIEWKGKTGSSKVEALGIFALKEADKKRYATFDYAGTGGAFPAAIGYRFDGETLILAVGEGLLKGEYKLERVKKK